ncbi:MAG: CPBP family intramembrane metalloprotease [Clostridiales bacterium]|nr:CPBP family intramembrane metalloprotease [Clostridiales bacterium]
MVQYNYIPNDNMQSDLSETNSAVKIISRTFFAVFALASAAFLTQFITQMLVTALNPGIAEENWYLALLTILSFDVIGFLLYYLVIRRIPDSPKKEVKKLKPSAFIMFFFICTAAMYIVSLLTQVIVFVISIIKGGEVVNPLTEVMLKENSILTYIYMVLIAPIIEELIFRKYMLNKLRRFGDLPAILITGLSFGIIHFNLHQFFYAAVLGFLFAYITIRSNTVKYSIILHMMINSIGAITSFFVLKESVSIIAVMLLTLWVFTAIILGIVFFTLNFKKIRFEPAMVPIRARAVFLNPGFFLFIFIGIVMFVITTLA